MNERNDERSIPPELPDFSCTLPQLATAFIVLTFSPPTQYPIPVYMCTVKTSTFPCRAVFL